jgi:hypothetical protein
MGDFAGDVLQIVGPRTADDDRIVQSQRENTERK